MMAPSFSQLWLERRKSITRSLSNIPISDLTASLSCKSSKTTTQNVVDPDSDKTEKRLDPQESWSMMLETGNCEGVGHSSQEEWAADLSQLFIGNRFASGATSRLYRGIYKDSEVAVKIIKPPDHDEATRLVLEQRFSSEVASLSHLNHPNIVQFIAACKKPPIYCIITEYMSQGTLKTYLHKKDPYSLSMETILRLALDISRGMEYLHSQGFIHRDLKPDNLLLNDEMHVKVADFGTSCLDTQGRHVKCNTGTYRWMAPEMVKEKPYTKKVDVYSFGIVLWELTTALYPFQGMTPIQAAYAACEKNLRPPLSETCPPPLNSLIQKCWSVNPVKRPDFSHIVEILEKFNQQLKNGHPFLWPPGYTSTSPLLACVKRHISTGT